MTTVNQHGKLNTRRSAMCEYGFDGGACGSAGVDHVVHKYHLFAGDVHGDPTAGRFRHGMQLPQIVSI